MMNLVFLIHILSTKEETGSGKVKVKAEIENNFSASALV